MSNVLVLDLETIPDRSVWSPPAPAAPADRTKCEKCSESLEGLEVAPNGLTTRKCTAMKRGTCRQPAEVEAKDVDVFAPRWAHQICVFGFCLIQDGIPTALGNLAGTTPQEERAILEAFAGFMRDQSPTLVTWNGRGFDLPVLQLRSLRHGIPQSWTANIRTWGDLDNSVDLADVLSGHQYGKTKGEFSLDSLAKLIGLPGKEEVDGSMVAGLIAAGNLSVVADYCERDVVQTTYLYFRHQLLRGRITFEEYKASCTALKAQWEPKIPRWKETENEFHGGSPINFERLELR